MATINEMRQVATQIENETTVGGNTAERVGGLFNDVVDKLEDSDDVLPLDNTPTEDSVKGVESGGVFSELQPRPKALDSSLNGDFGICDSSGHVIVKFAEGHVKTKEFDSSDIRTYIVVVDYEDYDLGISDIHGNVIVAIKGGNIFVKNFSSSPLFGKNCSFLGDSITTYDSYAGSYTPYYTGSNAGITSVAKTWWGGLCNMQGATINRIYANGGKDVTGFLCLHYNELFSNGTTGTPPDYIFILGGINDWYHGKTLGTIEDVADANATFYSAYKYMLEGMMQTYPYAQIVCLTPLNSMILGTVPPYANGNGVTIREFCDAVIECCEFYSLPYIDINRIVGVNQYNYSAWLNDYTHPNATGARLLTQAVNNNIRLFSRDLY